MNEEDEEDAVDDSEDLDEDYVRVQKSISGGRRRQSRSLVQEILPFVFSPLVRPLTVRDADCCTALEAAAFTDPAHRCTKEKVSRHSSFPFPIPSLHYMRFVT